jgi:Na+-translocating ferredoxin:NAD+ oxidoreductase subunit B
MNLILIAAMAGDPGMVSAVGSPAVLLGALGLTLGLGLAFAARKLAVPKDPLVEKITALLPGANCGGCSFPGCGAFAEALAAGRAKPNDCVAAGAAVLARIAEAIGAEVSESVRQVARVHCNGGHSATEAFEYLGPPGCRTSMLIMGGSKTCTYGCLGFGDCVPVCPFGAIVMGENGIPLINDDSCTGCGKCVAACPRDIIVLWPVNRQVLVACASHDKGAVARKACAMACIGCGKCVKICPVQAILVDDSLAIMDPLKCINCGLCASECPTGAILDSAPARPKAYIDGSCIGCTLCTKVCPTGAITGVLKERHEVDGEKCVGCGLCVQKCPKNSIRMLGALSYQRGEDFQV